MIIHSLYCYIVLLQDGLKQCDISAHVWVIKYREKSRGKTESETGRAAR